MPSSLRIIYMGSPDFAIPSLEILIEKGYQVVAVITAPDKPAGRGGKLQGTPVKEAALRLGLPLLQPTNLKDPAFLEELKSYQADLQIVVAFRMLPEVVWNMPRLGTLNLHGSLLPQYRGAAPINWAIINGEKETGCTTFFLKHEIDTGDLLFSFKEPINPEDTFEQLYQRLKIKGAELILQTVQAIEQGNYQPQAQVNSETLAKAPKLNKENTKIQWDKPAEDIRNLIRGLCPIPAAWTELEGRFCKIFKASVLTTTSDEMPGTWHSDGKSYIHVTTSMGILSILELQLEGKKRMGVEEFLRGYKFKN